jgi:hypothetical protein
MVRLLLWGMLPEGWERAGDFQGEHASAPGETIHKTNR